MEYKYFAVIKNERGKVDISFPDLHFSDHIDKNDDETIRTYSEKILSQWLVKTKKDLADRNNALNIIYPPSSKKDMIEKGYDENDIHLIQVNIANYEKQQEETQ